MGEDASQRKEKLLHYAWHRIGCRAHPYRRNVCPWRCRKRRSGSINGLREKVFSRLKSLSVECWRAKAINACEASLRLFYNHYLDFYLLHWFGSFAFEETVAAMVKIDCPGKIRRWGVSNLDYADMQARQLPGKSVCH
ncbi:aldo/keto reductase [Shigella flexneri]